MLFDAREDEYAGDPDLIYYERFRGHALHPTPESTRPEVPVRADEEGVALVCDGGLPHLRWVLSDGPKVRLGRLAYRSRAVVLPSWHARITSRRQMKTLTIKVLESLETRLRSIAVRRGESKSAVIRTALEEFVGSEGQVREGSCLDLARDLAGSTEGPRDLSVNKRHLAGYGR